MPGTPLTSPFPVTLPDPGFASSCHFAGNAQVSPRSYCWHKPAPGCHRSGQVAQLVPPISSKEREGVEGKTKIQDLTNMEGFVLLLFFVVLFHFNMFY